MHALPLKTPWQRILQHAHQWPSSRIAGCHFEIPSDIQILDPESFLTYQTDDQIPNTGDCKLLIRVLNKVPLHACCSARYFVSGALIDLMTYLWGQRTPTARMQVHELLVADGVMRMWSPRLPVIEGRVLFAITGRFLNMAFDPWSINQITNMVSARCCFSPSARHICPGCLVLLATCLLLGWLDEGPTVQPSVSLGKHHHHFCLKWFVEWCVDLSKTSEAQWNDEWYTRPAQINLFFHIYFLSISEHCLAEVLSIPSDGRHVEKAELREIFFADCIICTVGSPGRQRPGSKSHDKWRVQELESASTLENSDSKWVYIFVPVWCRQWSKLPSLSNSRSQKFRCCTACRAAGWGCLVVQVSPVTLREELRNQTVPVVPISRN